ncbi:MAG: uncharacterized protein KVP18_000691 [Porospora cf. gigantea A]|uniref:uncharacterized protein n=1 Tax=Porospora cf. gigantea A TaxID=2853593 RepID=UPI00355A1EDD|nr:MAG: hypothetical protein KVP18_000691 [Porospora cf. gigantea A]
MLQGGAIDCPEGSKRVHLQLLIVLDSSASMGPTFEKVKAQITDLGKNLSSTYAESSFGLVSFIDKKDPDWGEWTKPIHPYKLVAPLGLTALELSAAVNTLTPTRNQDNPESSFDALIWSLRDPKVGWQEGGGHQRVMALYTDDFYKQHDPWITPPLAPCDPDSEQDPETTDYCTPKQGLPLFKKWQGFVLLYIRGRNEVKAQWKALIDQYTAAGLWFKDSSFQNDLLDELKKHYCDTKVLNECLDALKELEACKDLCSQYLTEETAVLCPSDDMSSDMTNGNDVADCILETTACEPTPSTTNEASLPDLTVHTGLPGATESITTASAPTEQSSGPPGAGDATTVPETSFSGTTPATSSTTPTPATASTMPATASTMPATASTMPTTASTMPATASTSAASSTTMPTTCSATKSKGTSSSGSTRDSGFQAVLDILMEETCGQRCHDECEPPECSTGC